LCSILLIRAGRQQLLDVDNAYGACKALLDGIVGAAMLVDDEDRWLTSYRVRQDRGGEPAVEVTVTVPPCTASPTLTW
jgi:hypothetical protein